jgi:hypothetical protein
MRQYPDGSTEYRWPDQLTLNGMDMLALDPGVARWLRLDNHSQPHRR